MDTPTRPENPGKTDGSQAQWHMDQAFLLIAKRIVALMSDTSADGMTSRKKRKRAAHDAKTMASLIPFLDHEDGMMRNGERVDEAAPQ